MRAARRGAASAGGKLQQRSLENSPRGGKEARERANERGRAVRAARQRLGLRQSLAASPPPGASLLSPSPSSAERRGARSELPGQEPELDLGPVPWSKTHPVTRATNHRRGSRRGRAQGEVGTESSRTEDLACHPRSLPRTRRAQREGRKLRTEGLVSRLVWVAVAEQMRVF